MVIWRPFISFGSSLSSYLTGGVKVFDLEAAMRLFLLTRFLVRVRRASSFRRGSFVVRDRHFEWPSPVNARNALETPNDNEKFFVGTW